MTYLKWDEKIISDFSDQNINSLYQEGYLFTREGKGAMYQTRSLRIDLEKFELSSENRRILRKTEGLSLERHPLPCLDYHWSIGKMAKDFYDTKFGKGTFSVNKVKELLTEPTKSNFNIAFRYYAGAEKELVGFCIALETNELLHYCYPFYQLNSAVANLGLGMMLKAIVWAQEQKKKYVYLGSFSRPTDTYKLQFSGVEWWDGKKWETDLEELKKILFK